MPLDPEPYLSTFNWRWAAPFNLPSDRFDPREGYEQDESKYM